MKTKKFLMTSLLVMGMIIAKAANGYPPELVLVSQPVLTYNANSVTIYYDVQNIGDYTYRGDLYIYLDPDNGYCYATKYMRVCPGSIKRIKVSIPAYRPNPSWTYTVMPYYELGDELYSFTTFEYFEPVRFCWYGYHDEPWVVVHVGPRVRHYTRPGEFRFYYDGFRPMMPPPPGHGPGPDHGPAHPHDMPPMDPHHHTYNYHHSNGGYPANFTPEHETPGYNRPSEVPVARPTTSNTAGSSSSRPSAPATSASSSSGSNTAGSSSSRPSTSTSVTPSSSSSSSSGATTRPSSSSSSSSATARPSSSSSSSSSSSGTSSSSSSGATTRPSSSSSGSSSATARPSSSSSTSSTSRNASSTSGSSSSRGSGSTSRSSSTRR